MQGVRIAFSALVITSELHVTIAHRFDVTEADVRSMQHDLERLIRPHLPIQLKFGNFCKLGENGTIPAYKVYIQDSAVSNLIERYHAQYYKEQPGKCLYPKIKLHVTVDTPEKRNAFESMIREGRPLMVHDTLFRTRSTGSSEMTESYWKCPDCGTQNDIAQKECQFAHCSQWKPKPVREGDWNCPQCKYSNFASRGSCAKCNYSKNPYEVPPASAPPSSQRSDWWCPRCNFKIFGSKDKCGKCQTPRQ